MAVCLAAAWADAVMGGRFAGHRLISQNGFALVPEEEKEHLLHPYWTIPDRQIETSVVLGDRRRRAA